jgi:hypothetical protein
MSISVEALEQKNGAGEEVIDRYFDPMTTRVGVPRPMSVRRQPKPNRDEAQIKLTENQQSH